MPFLIKHLGLMASVFKAPHCRQIETPGSGGARCDRTGAFRYRFPAFVPKRCPIPGLGVGGSVSSVTHLGVPKALQNFLQPASGELDEPASFRNASPRRTPVGSVGCCIAGRAGSW